LDKNGRPYKKLMINIPPQHGKAIEDSTPVLTTKGWKTHGSLQIGDFVYNQYGKPVKIYNVQESYMHDCMRVEFDTGEKIVCSKEHLWMIEANRDTRIKGTQKRIGREVEILETQHIFDRYHAKSPAIRITEPLINDYIELPIEPYLLGCWLGDGSGKDSTIYSSLKDSDMYNSIPGKSTIDKKNLYRKTPEGLYRKLRINNLLKNKHIPEIYFNASYEQRLSLFQGLMDTDGTVNIKRGMCEFCNTNKRLAKEFNSLARSLGYKTTIKEYEAKLNGIYIGQKYRICFVVCKNDKVFRLQRKQERVNNKVSYDREDKKRYFIKNITPCGRYSVKCISVIDDIYLVGKGLIPTHNTRTLVNFCEWTLGKNTSERIIACSYNDDVASDFSRYTRDGIDATRNFDEDIIYSDIFPDTKIKQGNASYQKWALEGQFFNYIGSGVGGTITGKGGTTLLIDDPVKGAEEALNENHLDKLWVWYTSTFLSRTSAEHGEPLEILNMTRWSKKDLCGRILDSEDKDNWLILKMEAYDKKSNKMLCEDFLSYERYLYLRSQMVDMIFEANYHQKPIDLQGILYKQLKTYKDIPKDENGRSLFKRILSYTDTADTGNDWLCSIVFGEYNKEAYILDVYYTQDGMEITEPAEAKFLHDNKVNLAYIESNNGGRGFARAVQRILWENHKSRSPVIKWFHQAGNKEARIFSASAFVQEHIYLPLNWKDRWPDFHRDLISYLKEGKNKFDDAPDAITGIAEMIGKLKSFEFI